MDFIIIHIIITHKNTHAQTSRGHQRQRRHCRWHRLTASKVHIACPISPPHLSLMGFYLGGGWDVEVDGWVVHEVDGWDARWYMRWMGGT